MEHVAVARREQHSDQHGQVRNPTIQPSGQRRTSQRDCCAGSTAAGRATQARQRRATEPMAGVKSSGAQFTPSSGPTTASHGCGCGTAPAPASVKSCDINESNPVIWFDHDSTNIRTTGGINSTVHLMLAVRRAQGHITAAGPSARIYLYGYASEEGGDPHNQDLSERRARAIQGLLEAAGIDPINLVARGLGEDTSMGSRPLNRRVEICPTPTITHIDMPAETITADTVSCTSPTKAANFTQYAFLVSCLEAHLAATHGPLDILRTLREIYYGSSRFDAAACGERESGTVASLAITAPALLTALKKSKTVLAARPPTVGPTTIDPTTGKPKPAEVDVGHIFTGLEGMLCPRTSTSPAWYAPSVNMANEDFLTWGGDLGSAAAGRLEGYLDSGWVFKSDPLWKNYFLEPGTLASQEDLLGDIDAFTMRANATGFACSTTKGTRMPSPSGRISSMLLDFYSAPTGMASGMTSADRFQCFAEAVGAVIVGNSIINKPDLVNRFAPQVLSFANLFYLSRNKLRVVTGGSSQVFDALRLAVYSRQVTRLFFDWIDDNL